MKFAKLLAETMGVILIDVALCYFDRCCAMLMQVGKWKLSTKDQTINKTLEMFSGPNQRFMLLAPFHNNYWFNDLQPSP